MEIWEQRSIEQVKSKNDLPDGAIVRIYGSVPFLDGTLTTINFKAKPEDPEWQENYYYESGNDRQFFFVAQDLAEFVSRHPRLRKGSLIERFLDFTGIAGLIALIVTLVISFLVIFEALQGAAQISVPEILANALTIILGFYFGKATNQAQQTP